MNVGDHVRLKGRYRDYEVVALCGDERRVWVGHPKDGSVWHGELPFITNIEALEAVRSAVVDETPSPSFL